MKGLLQDLCHFINPPLCLHCKSPLEPSLKHLCLECHSQISTPLNFPWNTNQNAKIKLDNEVLVYVLFYYQKRGSLQTLFKTLKYRDNKHIASYLFFLSLKYLKFKIAPELICCIPLHPKKLKKRGYNQLHLFSMHLAKHLEIPFEANLLERMKNNRSQAERKSEDKFRQTSIIPFKYCGDKRFRNKNILLIDDIITSGQTIRSAVMSLKEAHGFKIQILSIASRLS